MNLSGNISDQAEHVECALRSWGHRSQRCCHLDSSWSASVPLPPRRPPCSVALSVVAACLCFLRILGLSLPTSTVPERCSGYLLTLCLPLTPNCLLAAAVPWREGFRPRPAAGAHPPHLL